MHTIFCSDSYQFTFIVTDYFYSYRNSPPFFQKSCDNNIVFLSDVGLLSKNFSFDLHSYGYSLTKGLELFTNRGSIVKIDNACGAECDETLEVWIGVQWVRSEFYMT